MEPIDAQLMSFVPMMVLCIPWAIAAYWIAPKMGRRRWVWVAIFLIPILNFIMVPIFVLLIAGAVLDRLNVLVGASKQTAP